MNTNFKPHDYQEHCIQQILSKPAVALWLECGLGKTLITLTALHALRYDTFEAKKILIIAPKKVAEATWQREIDKWEHLHLLKYSTVLGTVKQRTKALEASADIYITNRDNVKWLVEYYGKKFPFDTVVLDEASSFKNPKSQRFKALKAVRPKIRRVIELTGTPTPQGATDAWSQVYLLDEGERLHDRYNRFLDSFCEPTGKVRITDGRGMTRLVDTGMMLRKDKTKEFYDRISDICITMRAEDYLQMPDLVVHDVPVKLDTKAQKAYDTMAKEMVLQINTETLDVGSAAALRIKLQQIGNGAAYDEDRNVVQVHTHKLESLLELIEQIGDVNLLIFYAFQHDRDAIVDMLRSNKATKSAVTKIFSGAEDERAWNAGEIKYLLAHPSSCAYGLNIQEGGHHICWYGQTDSLELYQQANARLHRQGQDKPVYVHRLITVGGVDELIVERLLTKNGSQEALFNGTKALINRLKQ